MSEPNTNNIINAIALVGATLSTGILFLVLMFTDWYEKLCFLYEEKLHNLSTPRDLTWLDHTLFWLLCWGTLFLFFQSVKNHDS